jgi:hypothetical protein
VIQEVLYDMLGQRIPISSSRVPMIDLDGMKLEYLTDAAGRKTAVVLQIEVFQELLEDIEDLAAVAERREEPTVLHDELVAELKRDG